MAGAQQKQAAQQKATGVRAFKKAKKLNEAALKLVDEQAIQIAQLLLTKTIDGDVPSARLLMELAQKNVEAETAKEVQPLRSWASELAAEPEWTGEASEEGAETGVGGREPEGS